MSATGDRQRDLWNHTARVTAAIERIIREAPEQWLWLHRRWKLLAASGGCAPARAPGDGRRGPGGPGPARGSGTAVRGYDPRMEAVHRHLALRLARIVDQHGSWPGQSAAGADGAAAAWRVAHHAIATPALQRRFLSLVREAAARGEATPLQAAMLEDRVRHLEGRPSLYGTLLDWDEQGRLSAGPLEDTAGLDGRGRSSACLPSRRRSPLPMPVLASPATAPRPTSRPAGGVRGLGAAGGLAFALTLAV